MAEELKKDHPNLQKIRALQSSWVFRWRHWLRPIMSRRGTPEAIASGAAIGFFIAFTPTIGFQLLLAYFVATLLKANRPAALIPVWITTPITIPPVYGFTYLIGTFFVSGPPVSDVRNRLFQMVRRIDRHSLLDWPGHFREFIEIGRDIIVPMMIGGVIVGAVCAALAYPITRAVVREYRHRREVRRKENAARRRLHAGKIE